MSSSASSTPSSQQLKKQQEIIDREREALENEFRERRAKQIALGEKKRERTLSLAFGEGIKIGTTCTLTACAFSYGMSKYNQAFNKHMSLSAKASE